MFGFHMSTHCAPHPLTPKPSPLFKSYTPSSGMAMLTFILAAGGVCLFGRRRGSLLLLLDFLLAGFSGPFIVAAGRCVRIAAAAARFRFPTETEREGNEGRAMSRMCQNRCYLRRTAFPYETEIYIDATGRHFQIRSPPFHAHKQRTNERAA